MSPLAHAFNETSYAVTEKFGEDDAQRRYDAASDLVIEFLGDIGYEVDSLDDLDDEVSNTLQTLLVAACLRSDRLTQWLESTLPVIRDLQN